MVCYWVLGWTNKNITKKVVDVVDDYDYGNVAAVVVVVVAAAAAADDDDDLTMSPFIAAHFSFEKMRWHRSIIIKELKL